MSGMTLTDREGRVIHMNKKELLKLRALSATATMLRTANADELKTIITQMGNYSYKENRREYQLFLRAEVENGILKVALFNPDYLRAGAKQPAYTVYIEGEKKQFLTYDMFKHSWRTGKVDSLDWPQYISTSARVYLPRKEAAIIQTYLGCGADVYYGLYQYQKAIQEAEAERRFQKAVAPWDADMALTPDLPKDWVHWVNKVGITENFIFYDYKKGGAKQGYCTYCGKEVPLRVQPYHNKTGICPCCHRKIAFKARGRFSRLFTKEVPLYLIQQRPDGFIVREFWARRFYDKERGDRPEIWCYENERTVYDRQFNSRTYYKYSYQNRDLRWSPVQPPAFMGYYGFQYHSEPGHVYGKTLPRLKNTELKGTGLVEWIYAHQMEANPWHYLKVYSLVPPFEKIWKAGLPHLAKECMDKPQCMKPFIKDPQAHSLCKSLGIDTQELRRLRACDGGHEVLDWLQFEKEYGHPISDDLIQWFCRNDISTQDIQFILDRMSPVQICNYLRRQAAESQESVRQVLTTWRDYLAMAKDFGLDTGDAIIYRANKLRLRHDQLVMKCKVKDSEAPALEILKKHPAINEICQSLKKYEYEGEHYAVVAPNNVKEIYAEGFMLSHCLFRNDIYWDRMESHETYILFLRRRSAPDLPYYTLEIEPDGSVRQKRTKFDRQGSDIEDVKEFLKEWQAMISKRLTSEDRRKAAKSKVLREEEFEQLRKDDVRIHTGNLAGQRLVDVLMADAMDAA